MKWLRRFSLAVSLTLVGILGAVFLVQNTADGPIGPITGSQFSSGIEIPGTIDLSEIVDFNDQIEFQLLGDGTSRTAGVLVHEGELFIPCDLGFIWNRFPPSVTRTMLHTIYLFKDWHEAAALDGRVLIRKKGYIYRRHLTKVTDTILLDALRATVVEGLEQISLPVEKLDPLPTQGPRDIWFFRVDIPI